MPKFTPPEGPSPEARQAAARALEDGLREAYPGWDFTVTPRRPNPFVEVPAWPSPPLVHEPLSRP